MGGTNSLVIEASLDRLEEVRGFVSGFAKEAGVDEDTISDFVLAVDEAVTNIIVHGYRNQPGSIEVKIENNGGSLCIRLMDRAPKFDPCSHQSLNLEAALEKDTPGGFGLHLIRRIADELEYETDGSGRNVFSLIKHYSAV